MSPGVKPPASAGYFTDTNLAEPAPIGLYFAKLWYFERLYPLIFSLDALGRLPSAGRQNP